MQSLARGYIASGEFNGYRTPQHLQNQVIRLYCETNGLKFVLSRAEYWINGSTDCQLWAALNEEYKHIVFYSLWQLPNKRDQRKQIYQHCINNNIVLHFAAEQIKADSNLDSFIDIETLIQSNLLILEISDSDKSLELIKNLI